MKNVKMKSLPKVQYGNMEMVDTNGDGSFYHYKGEVEFSLSGEELNKRGIVTKKIIIWK